MWNFGRQELNHRGIVLIILLMDELPDYLYDLNRFKYRSKNYVKKWAARIGGPYFFVETSVAA
jgi:hypothetical protein